MRTSIFSVVFASSLVAFVHCGGTTVAQTGNDAGQEPETSVIDAGPDVDNGAASDTYPAFTVDAPQVVTGGGPVLSAPKIVPVYFANDDTSFTDQLTTFLNKLPASTYWGPSVQEYGVGAITVTAPIQLTENAPDTLDDATIQTWLAGKMGDSAWPTADANTIYVLFYPSNTSITLGQGGGTSCQDFGGYHDNITTTEDIAYAVLPRCDQFGGLTGVDAVSAATSHEIIEAATDPFPQSNAAFGQVDDNHIIWEFVLGGGETGDMCAQSQSSYFVPSDLGVTVQRTWSNAAAKAGHDPCLPSDGTPYFNSMPLLSEKVNVAGQISTKGITIPVGQSKTIEVDLFSDAKTSGPWTVSATDSATLQGQTPELKFDWDRTSGVNGEKLHLTITVVKASQYNAEGFMIDSKLNGRRTFWAGLVGN